MKYMLQNVFHNELTARQKYIYQALSIWTIISSNSPDWIHLTSVPSTCLDILFIVGHNNFVKRYLETSSVSEKMIVAITCNGSINFSKLRLPGKTIYLPHQNENNYVDLINGKLYGFDFDLTESEIQFYNSKNNANILQRLDTSFNKL